MCKYCEARGKTWNGSDPVCAFPDNNSFNPDNWACAAMFHLRDIAQRVNIHYRNDMDFGSFGAVPFEDYEGDHKGFIVMTWYKDRGRTDQAIVMEDEGQPYPLNYDIAQAAIEYWQKTWTNYSK